jgi:putative membrane protein
VLPAIFAVMDLAARIVVLFVAALHVYFLVLEMFLWTTPFGVRTFGRPREEMLATKVMAGNQGLYNGFLAAGLAWSLVATDAFRLRVFFLGCVLVAGVYGGATAARAIFYVQALPGAVALALVWLAG